MAKLSQNKIPFTKVTLTGHEAKYVNQCLQSGHLQGDGPFSKDCEKLLETLSGAKKVLLTTSGTDALELATLLCDIGPGDEVIMPSFTFVSSANAVVLRGATPVFVDISDVDLNIDATLIEAAITPKTRAIMPVHYAGFSCDMTAILALAKHYRLKVIEDAAHGVGAYWKKQHLGTIGDLGMLSFHQTKNIAAGECGAILINDSALQERAEVLREKGTNRRKFLRGEVDKYTWVDVGSSFLPSDITAALLKAQLESMKGLNKSRTDIFDRYRKLLTPLQEKELIKLPETKNDNTGNGHLFYILTKTHDLRDKLRSHLAEDGIQATSHYEPLHCSPAGERFARINGSMSVTESCAQRILRLPLFAHLSQNDQDKIVGSINSFFHTHA